MNFDEALKAAEGKACLICGDDSDSAKDAILSYTRDVPEMQVCWTCAKKLANGFWKQHSGEWLTSDWIEERGEPPRVRRKERIGAELRKAVFERDMYRCKACGTHLDLTVDHIHPESRGGTLDMSNLQTLGQPCNSRKGAKA